MLSNNSKQFFGLFGCETTNSTTTTNATTTTTITTITNNNNNSIEIMKPQNKKKLILEISNKEHEEGEIIEKGECNIKERVQFDTLISNYKREITETFALKEAKKCLICFENKPKYTCPKCAMRTCSLNCCILHKEKQNCDGIRNRLSFIPIKNYSIQNFNSGKSNLILH